MGVLCWCGVLDDILFICIEFISVWVRQGNQIGQGRDGVEMGCFVVVLGVNLSGSLGREQLGFVRRGESNGVSVILGILDGIGVDFVACELCGTTRYIRTTMNKLLNVNLSPYYENDRNSQIFQYYKALKSLVFCNRSATHFIILKYKSDIQSAASQSASNNLQLCYQKYLLSVCFQLLAVLKLVSKII